MRCPVLVGSTTKACKLLRPVAFDGKCHTRQKDIGVLIHSEAMNMYRSWILKCFRKRFIATDQIRWAPRVRKNFRSETVSREFRGIRSISERFKNVE